jgi:hypothetical protein
MKLKPTIWGLLAEFDSPTELITAIEKVREEGYSQIEAYTPFPVEEVPEALGLPKKRTMSLVVLIGGILGGLTGFFMQYYAAVISYPVNVGGRPFNSWPSFIPITFELTVLGAATFAVVGMLALNGLPRPYHPLFNVPRFARASRDRFFLCIEATDPKFDVTATKQFLLEHASKKVFEVPP